MNTEMSREDALNKLGENPNSSATQKALVAILTNEGGIKRNVYVVPGGKFLTETEDETTLDKAVYNWIRRGGDFERFEISLAGDFEHIDDLNVDGFKPRRKQLMDFNWKNQGLPVWKRKGLKEYSVLLAKAILEAENPLSVSLEKEGLFITLDTSKTFTPESPRWNPVLIVHNQIR